MINQQQPQPQISPDEIGAEWGMKLGAALLEKIAIQKQAERLTVINRKLEAEMAQMAETVEAAEVRLVNRVQELEVQITEFIKQEAALVDHIQGLQAELEVKKASDRVVAEVGMTSQVTKDIEGV